MKRNQKKNRFNSWHVLLSLFAYFWLLATMMLYGINRMNIFFRHCWADAFTLCVVYVVPVCFVSNCLTLHTTEASKCYVELKLKRQTAVSERWGMRFHSVHFIVNTMLVLMIQSDTDSTLFFHLHFIFVCITDIFYIIRAYVQIENVLVVKEFQLPSAYMYSSIYISIHIYFTIFRILTLKEAYFEIFLFVSFLYFVFHFLCVCFFS